MSRLIRKPWRPAQPAASIERVELMDFSQLDVIVQHVVQDILETMRAKKERENTLFYKIVEGNNMEVVSHTLQMLHDPQHRVARDWLLGLNLPVHRPERKTFICHILRLVMFFLTSLAFTLLTPVFYMCHSAMSALWNKILAKVHCPLHLPLYLACQSESINMVEVFQKEGVMVEATDHLGNNVIHLLAMMSQRYPQQAKLTWQHLCQVYPQADMLALCTAHNHFGFTPLEMAVRHGSMAFLCTMLESPRLYRKVELLASRGFVRIHSDCSQTSNRGQGSGDEDGKNGSCSTFEGVLQEKIDLTQFESGDILGEQSVLLSILSHRHTNTMGSDDMRLLLEGSVMSAWVDMKISGTWVARLLSNFYGVGISILLVTFLYLVGILNVLYPLKRALHVLIHTVVQTETTKTFNATNILNVTIAKVLSFCIGGGGGGGGSGIQGLNLSNWCLSKSIQQLHKQCGGKLTREELLLEAGVMFDHNLLNTLYILDWLLCITMAMYIAYDLLLRLIFAWKCLSISSGSFYGGLFRICCHRIPGSYLSKQLSVAAFMGFLASRFFLLYYIEPLSERYHQLTVGEFEAVEESEKRYQEMVSYMTTLCMLLRLASLIHTLRLLPALGHFIITSFLLAQTLFRFFSVYALILVAFGSAFHFLLKDPSCPSLSLNSYRDIPSSIYQAFLLTFGMTLFPEPSSTLAKCTYINFIVLCVIVLLNLIIAVMTTVVEETSSEPQKQTICLMHHLADALAAETCLHILTFPIASRFRKWYLDKSGGCIEVTTVEKDGKMRCAHQFAVYLILCRVQK